MEALSIAGTCMSVAGGLYKLSTVVTLFALEVRAAKKDMDAVAREITSLELCLKALENDQRRRVALPENISNHVVEILKNCELITNQMEELLLKLKSGRFGRRVQWAAVDKQGMNGLRSSLESNKTALDIAMSVGAISQLADQKTQMLDQSKQMTVIVAQNKGIATTTTRINLKVDDIAVEISELRHQMTKMPAKVPNSILQNFMEESRKCIERALEPIKANLSQTAMADDTATSEASEMIRTLSLTSFASMAIDPYPDLGHGDSISSGRTSISVRRKTLSPATDTMQHVMAELQASSSQLVLENELLKTALYESEQKSLWLEARLADEEEKNVQLDAGLRDSRQLAEQKLKKPAVVDKIDNQAGENKGQAQPSPSTSPQSAFDHVKEVLGSKTRIPLPYRNSLAGLVLICMFTHADLASVKFHIQYFHMNLFEHPQALIPKCDLSLEAFESFPIFWPRSVKHKSSQDVGEILDAHFYNHFHRGALPPFRSLCYEFYSSNRRKVKVGSVRNMAQHKRPYFDVERKYIFVLLNDQSDLAKLLT